MNDRFLESTLAEWLHATDAPLPDAPANVHVAVERAAHARQWGWAPRRRPSSAPRRASGLRLPVALGAVAVAIAAVGLVLAMLLTHEQQTAQSPASAVTTEDGLHWQTELIDLQADAFRLELDDKVYTTVGVPIHAASGTGPYGQPILRLDWTEHGDDMRLELVAVADSNSGPYTRTGGDWWIEKIRVRRQGSPEGWLSYEGPLFLTPQDEDYAGDVELSLYGANDGAAFAFDGMRLAVSRPPDPPWWKGARIFGIPIPDFIGPLLPEPEGWSSEPTEPTAPEPRVLVPFADAYLEGRLRSDDVVRITSDKVKHRMDGVVDVAIGPDDAVWVARRQSVFELGKPGAVGTKKRGPELIERIESNEDGSLTAHGDGTWRLDDGAWSRISDVAVPTPHADASDLDEAPASDFVVAGRTSDGSVWGHSAERTGRLVMVPGGEYTQLPTAVLTKATEAVPVELVAGGLDLRGEDLGQGVVRVTHDGTGRSLADAQDLVVGADGSVWVATRNAVHRLGQDEPPAFTEGPQWIDRISLTGDGDVIAHGDGQWLYRDGEWRDLLAPLRGRVGSDGELGGVRVAGATLDGQIWGSRFGEDTVDGPFRWTDDGWVGVASSEMDDPYLMVSDSLWAVSDALRERGHDWARLHDDTWLKIGWDPSAVLGEPDAEILHSWPADGDSFWFTAGTGAGEPEYIVRFAGDEWSSRRLEDIELAAGVEVRLRPGFVRDSKLVSLKTVDWDPRVGAVLFDGESAWVLPTYPPDFEPDGLTDDGSVWGIGRDGSLLVMPQAATATKLDEAWP